EQRPKTENARAATEWYVSPSGQQTNTGAIDSPWNLAYALGGAGGSIQPGDTVWLRGGTYEGNYVSSLSGTESARITIKQYPGERAIISDNRNGSGMQTLVINGSWTDYIGFEITNSSTDRVIERPTGLTVLGPNSRIINLVIHDAGNGVGFWSPATNSELYGNLSFNNGWQAAEPDRGHGHGVYTQNATGTKQIKDNIFFNQYGWGVQAYTTNGSLNGFNIDGNASFNNGAAARNERNDNILVGGHQPAENATITNNYTYHPLDAWGMGLHLGYSDTANVNVITRDNYIVGGIWTNNISRWSSITMTGNTFYSPLTLMELRLPDGTSPPPPYTWDNNTYYDGSDTAFKLYDINGTKVSYDFDGWKAASGLDTNSTYSSSSPTGLWKFVRPNAYDSQRANVVVYNWDNLDTTTLSSSDLSGTGISNNDAYEIRDVQNYFGDPIATGRYNGSSISLPLPDTNGTAAQPIGGTTTVSHTSKEFNSYVLSYTPATYHTITPSVSGQGSLSISSPTQVLGGDDLTVTT
ncbi:MAG: hypothetical protein AAB360_04320, partial [Patescibacteria group bacterium]